MPGVEEIGRDLAGGSGSSILGRRQSGWRQGLQSSERMFGAGRHTQRWLILLRGELVLAIRERPQLRPTRAFHRLPVLIHGMAAHS